MQRLTAALLAKASVRDVSRRFGVSKSAVDRHKRGCLPQIQERGRELRTAGGLVPMLSPDQTTPYIDRIERVADKMEMIMDGAIRRADDKLAIMAGREVTRNLELFGKASGELYRDTALGNNQPMFILPPGARIAVTVNQPVVQALAEDEPTRNITPEKNPPGITPSHDRLGENSTDWSSKESSTERMPGPLQAPVG